MEGRGAGFLLVWTLLIPVSRDEEPLYSQQRCFIKADKINKTSP